MDILQILAGELQIRKDQAEAAVQLIDEGNTIPFIARYRKEVTGALDDEVLRKLDERLTYLRNLDEKKEQDWFILKYPNHDSFHQFMKKLNHLYLDHSCLSSKDYELDGFTWLDCHQEARSIYAFERKDEKERIVVVLNLSAQTQEGFEMTVKDSKNKSLHLLLDSNEDIYGGTTHYEKKVPIRIKKEKVTLDLPPFSAFYYLVK